MSFAYLGLGSNLGDRAANLLQAMVMLIAQGLQVAKASSVYETEPFDVPAPFVDQPQFLNMVIEVSASQLDPYSLLSDCLDIERRLGRDRSIERGARTVDIDLLLLEDQIVDGTRGEIRLTLPHPRLHLRRFVLEPLGEIAPDLVHPVTKLSVREMLAIVSDNSSVKIYGS